MAQLARLLARTRTDAASRQRALRLVRDLELDWPADPEVLAAMGAATLSAGGDPRRALPWLQAARDGSPDDPGIRYHLALAWSRAGDRSAARRELQEALKSGRPFDEEPEARRLSRHCKRSTHRDRAPLGGDNIGCGRGSGRVSPEREAVGQP